MKGNNVPDTDDSVAMLGSASVFSTMDAAHAADENASAASFSTDSSIAAYRQVVPSNAATPIDKQLDVRRSAAASESRGSTSHRPVEHADRFASMEAIMGDINKMLNRIDSLTSAMQKQQDTPNEKPRVAPHDSSDDARNSATAVIFNVDDASTWTFWLRRDRSGALATQLVMQEVLSGFVGSKKSRKKRFGPFRAHIQNICRLMASMKRITQEAVGAANAAVAATREAVKKSSAVTPAAAQPQPPQTKSKLMSAGAAAAAAASSPEKPTMKKKKKNRSRCLICLKRGHTLRDCEVRQVLVALAESYMTDSD